MRSGDWEEAHAHCAQDEERHDRLTWHVEGVREALRGHAFVD